MEKRTAKLNRVIYDVRPTGKIRKKKAKSYTDFNGYEVDKPGSSEPQLGMYLNDKLEFTISEFNGQLFAYRDSQKYGSIYIRTTLTP